VNARALHTGKNRARCVNSISIEKIGDDKVWLLKKVGIQKISTKFNPFWRDIFLNWSTILEGEEVNDATYVKCQPIWLNPRI
jgi:hypothetical protein